MDPFADVNGDTVFQPAMLVYRRVNLNGRWKDSKMQDEFLAARCNILSGTRLTFFARHLKTDVAFAPMIHGSVETYSERKLTNIGDTAIFHWSMIMGGTG